MKLFLATFLLISTSSCEGFQLSMSTYSAGSQPSYQKRINNSKKRRRQQNTVRHPKQSTSRGKNLRNNNEGQKRKKWVLERQVAAKELKDKVFELAALTERGFQCTSDQREEMNELVNQLALLNPTPEPAWSYYGVLSRQLHLSMNDKRDEATSNDPSLEGKWTLVYTDVPEITSLSLSPYLGLAKLGRIGQECTPFPNYTVKNVIELKRPEWAKDMPLLGTDESGILQKMTMRAKASPRNPGNIGLSSSPQGVELLSLQNSNSDHGGADGLDVLNPFYPWKIGLQLAGFDNGAEPWKLKVSGESGKDNEEKSIIDLAKSIQEKGFLAGLLSMNPIQLGNTEGGTAAGIQSSQYNGGVSVIGLQEQQEQREQQILYLDDDIRIIKDSENYFRIDTRSCLSSSEECWF